MGEVGKVIGKNGASLTVSLTRTEACASCRACIVGMQKQEMLMTAKNACGANVGDYVNIELEQGVFIKAAAIMYAVPLTLLVAGFFGGYYLSGSEILGFFAGLAFLFSGYVIINKNERHFKAKGFVPVAVDVTEGEE